MRKLRHTLSLSISLSLALSGCFYTPVSSQGKVTVLDGAARPAQASLLNAEKAVYTMDPNSKSDTLLQAPSGALSGSSVTVPTGSLAIATDIIFEQAAPIGETSLASTFITDTDVTISPVGAGLLVRPSEETELLGALIISLPLDSSASLTLADSSTSKNYAVFYKQFIGGSLQDGVIPGKDLRFTDDNRAVFEGYFGAYWLVTLSTPIEVRVEVKAQEAIVNFQKVAVIETSGVVTEKSIVTKSEQAAIAWKTTSISFDAGSRSVLLLGETNTVAALNSCKADFFLTTEASSGQVVETGSQTKASFTPTKPEAHQIFGRFRCLDAYGRQTISPWSSAANVTAVAGIAENEGTDTVFGDGDLRILRPQLQSRQFLKMVLGANQANSKFQIFNNSSGLLLYDPTTAKNLKLQNQVDGSQLFSFKLSPLGSLQGYIYGQNSLSLRTTEGVPLLDLAVTIRDFTIFESSGSSFFEGQRQTASDGFQAWTSVLANPVVNERSGGDTQLSNGMLSIINP